jgi:DNA polymerase-4
MPLIPDPLSRLPSRSPGPPMDGPPPWVIFADMDAFYVSCELTRHSDLRGRPVAVGVDPSRIPSRGVVLSASYEARARGVRSALPCARAVELCPELCWVPPDFDFYEDMSRCVMQILRQHSPEARAFSIDEAAYVRQGLDETQVWDEARRLQAEIHDRLQLPCSVGVAPALLVAKMASDRAKPGGIVVVPPEAVPAFLGPLPLRSVPGIGPVTEQVLKRSGADRVADLEQVPRGSLSAVLGEALSGTLLDLLHGRIPPLVWEPPTEPRSLGAMKTFPRDVDAVTDIWPTLETLATTLIQDLHRRHLQFRTVTLRARFGDFSAIQRSRTLPQYTAAEVSVKRTAFQLLHQLLGSRCPPWTVRTVGLTLQDLRPDSRGQKVLPLDDGRVDPSHGTFRAPERPGG